MKLYRIILAGFILFPVSALGDTYLYCSENHGYVKLGMTESEVIAACGQPIKKTEAGNQVVQKVPVTQLIYTTPNLDTFAPSDDWAGVSNIYKQWSLPSGTHQVRLEINIMNNKISSILINGETTNAQSICEGGSFEIGDNESAVYQACGSPSIVNNTYVNRPVPSNEKPEVWVYQNDQYQQPISLTIINGKLQSIDK